MIKNTVKYFDYLNNRMDASFYRERFNFTSKSYSSFHLSELLWINPTVKYENLSGNSAISFVPMEVVDEQNGKIAERRTTTVSKNKGFTRFKENDLIWAKITPCMQNGKSAIAQNLVNGYGCGSTEFYVLRPKADNVLIEYIHFILRDKRVLESAKNSFGGSAGQQRVSCGYLKSIRIPLPPIEKQRQIVDLYQRAVEEKQAKEREAAALLDGIDDYLLKELGIALPENTGKERCFKVNILDLIGGRFDPYYNRGFFNAFTKNITESGFHCKKIKDIICFLESGSRPSGGVSDIKQGVLSIGGEHIGTNCEIELKTPKYIPVDFHKKIQNTQTRKLDILLVKDGATTGKVAIVDKTEFELQNINEHVFMMRVKESVKPYFLLHILYSSVGQIQIQRGITGATVTGLTKDVVNNMIIPFPPIEKQAEIAEHIQSIRAEAKRLREEAACALEKAKREIESMITV
ncbi:MAG: restriction endonuclease subunit S [Chitinispirillales bacterium]|jgi:type I restriction enzyme S subunit|nr:restriction endonuclease subunit S [Chitinispirillales bacterium]